MEQRWNDTDGKSKNSEKNLSEYHFVTQPSLALGKVKHFSSTKPDQIIHKLSVSFSKTVEIITKVVSN
jgi:hypothetical protein